MIGEASPAPHVWHRFLAITAISLVPTVVAIATLPIYGPAMDDAGLIPTLIALTEIGPGLALLIAAGGLVGAFVAREPAKRAKHRATAAAAGWSLAAIVALCGLVIGLLTWTP